MQATRRFAIYAAPGTGPADADSAAYADTPDPAPGAPDGAPDAAGGAPGALLRERAEQWLGRSAAGSPVTPGVPAGWTRAAIDAMTIGARRYGFHGTLKPPFRLAGGRTSAELDAAVARFAAGREAAVVPELSLTRIGGFFALVPGTEAPDLYALADAVVTGFDCFRAPADAAEIARRRPDSLTPRRRELLRTWGYPYVLDEFRFHLTLTDRIPAERWPEVERVLGEWFAPVLGTTVPVDSLAVFSEPEPGAPFTLHAVHPLRPRRPITSGRQRLPGSPGQITGLYPGLPQQPRSLSHFKGTQVIWVSSILDRFRYSCVGELNIVNN